jgi:hypothetical protein
MGEEIGTRFMVITYQESVYVWVYLSYISGEVLGGNV